jgi:hypothetical protein
VTVSVLVPIAIPPNPFTDTLVFIVLPGLVAAVVG